MYVKIDFRRTKQSSSVVNELPITIISVRMIMQKNKSFNSSSQYKVSVPVEPEVVTSTELEAYSDDELNDRVRHLEDARHAANVHKMNTYAWEIEISYVNREIQIRQARVQYVQTFMTNNCDLFGQHSSNTQSN